MKILIVEDDEYKRKSVEMILEEIGINFCCEKAINPALRYIKEHHDEIDAIILDLGLPRFDSGSIINIIPLGGMCIVEEMTRLELEIPILINSYDAFSVQYDEHFVDTHNIKDKTSPSMTNF